MNKFVTFGVFALLAVLAMPTVSANHLYLLPDNSSVPGYCDTTEVELWLNATEQLQSLNVNITYICCCANITDYASNLTIFEDQSVGKECGWLNIGFANWVGGAPANVPAGLYHLGNITIHCCNTTPPCQTDLLFSYAKLWYWTGLGGDELSRTTDNGTFTCGTTTPSEETFSKPLYEGWNLISLPLVPDDTSVSAVLSTVSYDAVYRYNATSKQFESDDVMNPGTGYFVNVTEDCTWEYSGTSYTSANVPMEHGLNMVGWLNCSKDVSALSSISDKYRYVARWNATAEKFEVYNSVAPAAFNDFQKMDRGTGYFISAKQVCTLSESC